MSDVKIFVSHRIDLNSIAVDNSVYVPVRCGAEQDTNDDPTMIGDNTGDNVSDKREYLGEFTVQYWAWKNVQADYYGLCHYRRYLSFSEERFKTDEKAQVVETYLSPEAISRHRLDDPEYIQSVVEQYDALVGEYADITQMYTPRGCQKNLYSHFEAYDNYLVEKEDIDLVLDTIGELYPDMEKDAREYFSGKKFRGYNCFILKRELFFELCEIEKNVLQAIAKTGKVDFTGRSSLEKRSYGFFCEWIYGIFLYHLEQERCYRIKQLQLVFFENTERPSYIMPKQNSIAVAYLTSRYFLPMTQTSIQSLFESKKPDTVYDIILAHEDLTKDEINQVETYFSKYRNITVRFISFRSMVPTASNGLRWERADNVTYVTGFLPWILKDFSRVIYLHSDILINTDLSSLFGKDLNGCCLAAPRDYLRICESYKDTKIMDIRHKKLLMKDHNCFFSTSFMLMDLSAIRERFSVDLMLRYSLGAYYLRDAMNRIFDGCVELLPAKWNVCSYSSQVLIELSNFMPAFLAEELKEAREYPCAFHYPMHPKPWIYPYDKDAFRFWQLARQTQMYEQMLANLCISLNGTIHDRGVPIAVAGESFPRRISNIFFPKGSVRRELLKKICPKDSVVWNFFKRLYYAVYAVIKR